jgi:hypothetical protein
VYYRRLQLGPTALRKKKRFSAKRLTLSKRFVLPIIRSVRVRLLSNLKRKIIASSASRIFDA